MPASDGSINVFGHDYKIGRMSAMRQFHVTRRLAAVFASVGEGFGELRRQGGADALITAAASAVNAVGSGARPDVYKVLRPVLDAIAHMKDEDAEFVVNSCLDVVERRTEGGAGWSRIMPQPGVLMFMDIEMPAMLALTFHVLQDNLAGFFFDLLSGLTASETTESGSNTSAASSTG